MNTTTHCEAPEQVMAFLDGELSAADSQAMSAHLDRCAECSVLARQFRSTSLSLSNWNVQAVPLKLEDSVTDLAAKACSGLKIGGANLFIRASFWPWRQWALGSGALVALVLLLTIFLSPLQLSRQAARSEPVYQRTQQTTSRTSNGLATLDSGIAVDSNDLLHGRADHAENSFSVDGLPKATLKITVTSPPMIARSVSLSIVVKDLVASRSSLDSILARHHGYSAQLNTRTPDNAPRSLQASLRIPAPEFAVAVDDLKALGRVENESQSGEEITQQHTDLAARLKNSQETEQRLRTILQQRTGKVAEILQVEEEIARVRGDIERMEAEQKALEHRVDFATVELQLAEEYKAQLNPPAASVSTRIHNALVAGYGNASETVLGIVLFFAEFGPALLIWLVLLLFPVLLLWRRYRKALTIV